MARFRGTLKGNRGETSRLGSASSGLRAYVNGWNAGVSVDATPDSGRADADEFTVYATGGSNGTFGSRAIAHVRYDPLTRKRRISVNRGDGTWITYDNDV